MQLLTYILIFIGITCSTSNVVKDSFSDLLEELEDLERTIHMGVSDDSVDATDFSSTSNHIVETENNITEYNRSSIEDMVKELKDSSSNMMTLLIENNVMLKALLKQQKPEPEPQPQPETLTEVFDIENPELDVNKHFPYIMEPIILLRDVTGFPEALKIHMEGEFTLPENLGLRIGWTDVDKTRFGDDDLPWILHIRWNGHHTEYADETFNRKIVANYRLGGEWGKRPIADVPWPFKEFEPFTLDVNYVDGCFLTTINSGSNSVEIPMCQFPEGRGTLYFALNFDKEIEVPVNITRISVSLKSQPKALTEVVNIENPKTDPYQNFPYIMEPIILLRDATEFPEALKVHMEGEFTLPENLGLRIGWTDVDVTRLEDDDLPFFLHIRWNGHHTQYADETFNRRIVANYRLGGEFGNRPIPDVPWPFKEFEPFTLDVNYEDGCFWTAINGGSNNVEFPMCQFPEGRGTLYLALNFDKEIEVPVNITRISVSLKETPNMMISEQIIE